MKENLSLIEKFKEALLKMHPDVGSQMFLLAIVKEGHDILEMIYLTTNTILLEFPKEIDTSIDMLIRLAKTEPGRKIILNMLKHKNNLELIKKSIIRDEKNPDPWHLSLPDDQTSNEIKTLLIPFHSKSFKTPITFFNQTCQSKSETNTEQNQFSAK